jgi:hypothetical protein
VVVLEVGRESVERRRELSGDPAATAEMKHHGVE